MGNLEGFNANEVDPKTDFEPVPKGDYDAMLVSGAFEPNSKRNGQFLKFEAEITSGQYRGRRLFDRLNLDNPNETAVKIAKATLSSICRAVGVMQPKDSSQLLNKPLRIKVDVEERDDKPGSYSNRITNYEAIGASSASQGGSSAQGGGQQQGGGAPDKPWLRRSA